MGTPAYLSRQILYMEDIDTWSYQMPLLCFVQSMFGTTSRFYYPILRKW